LTQVPAATGKVWFGITSNYDMSIIAATVQFSAGINQNIWLSRDEGTTFIALTGMGFKDWRGIICSSNFSKIVASGSGVTDGFIYHSIYNGVIDATTTTTRTGPVTQLALWRGV
jgi:hypothetical protein